MEVTPACYAHLVSALMGLASGKVAVVLEVNKLGFRKWNLILAAFFVQITIPQNKMWSFKLLFHFITPLFV